MSGTADSPLPTGSTEVPAGDGAWRALAARELAPRGAAPDLAAVDRLVSRTLEGVELRALYPAAPAPAAASGLDAPPGVYPFVRGSRAPGSGWIVAARHEVAEVSLATEAVAEDLARGAEAIVLAVDRAGRLGLDAGLDLSREAVGDGGVALVSAADLSQLLAPVDLAETLVWLDAGANAAPFVAGWLASLAERDVEVRGMRLFGGLDPGGALARDGALPRPPSALGAEAAELVGVWKERGLRGRPLAVSTTVVHEAGGHAAHEIGFALAGVAEMLRALEGRGVAPATAAAAIALEISLGPDVFGAIAKTRALRLGWSKLLVAAGLPRAALPAPFVAARTSGRAQSTLDPWLNAVRGTTEAFAAAVAGVDLLVVRPWDEPLGAPDRASRRLARNTQLLLRDESHLAEVADPAAGSGFLEQLTQDLARAGWAELRRIEAAGGLLAALEAGVFQAGVREAGATLARDVARRKAIVVGANDFARVGEAPPHRDPPRDPAAASRAAERAIACRRPSPTVPDDSRLHVAAAIVARGDSYAAASQVLAMFAPDAPPSCEALRPQRTAARFEALRRRAEELQARTGRSPSVIIAPLGPLAGARARVAFAQRLFEVGGFTVAIGEPLAGGVTEAVRLILASVEASQPSVVCLAGPDEVYLELAEPLATALAAPRPSVRRAPVVVQAGKPPAAREAALREAGLSAWFFAGGDAAEVLEEILARLDVRASKEVAS